VNSVYGKFIENQKNQTEIRYVQNGAEALTYLNSPYTKGYSIVNESLIIFEQTKKRVVLDRPIQIGVTILEYAKLVMFSYFHNVLKKSFGDRVKLLYTDTDSFVIELRTRDLYADLSAISHTLDTSNFPKENHYLSGLFTNDNNSELFYFKSEVGGDDIVAFIALRAKVYSLIRVGEKRGEMLIEILNKLKGVNRDAVETIGKLNRLIFV
jgi:hypothetical protein